MLKENQVCSAGARFDVGANSEAVIMREGLLEVATLNKSMIW